MELLDLLMKLIILIEERLPTKTDASAFMRTHPCLLQILQKRLYSRAKPSKVDLNLRWACKMGNEGLAFAMLRVGANVHLSVDDPMPLSIAAIHGQLNMVESLVKHDPKIINETSDNTCTPIMGATIKGHMEIVKFLLAQPDLDPQKQSSYFSYDRIHQVELGKKLGEYDTHKTLIDQALYDGNWELVQILLADIRVELSASSSTAAARGGNEDLIRLCLLRYPQTFDPAQESLPIIATRNNDIGLFKLLLEAAGHISETEWAPDGTTSFVSAAIQDTQAPTNSC
ncbi:hypothetical protein N7527_002964 [Penicillium freii]|uniref:Uncharacterized protein n=1 Tax=Penicillium freii TaxID=48697 RepID=A0A117NN31_PENFR|nr:hypothetical protein N7527_002964 [Penicillium freii]KUM60233.1 hypothetical protein ACN42_g6891 [Penicillium freii]